MTSPNGEHSFPGRGSGGTSPATPGKEYSVVASPAPAAVSAEAALPSPGGFDAHTHIDILGLPVGDVMAAARAAGIHRAVNIGCDLPSSRWSHSLSKFPRSSEGLSA